MSREARRHQKPRIFIPSPFDAWMAVPIFVILMLLATLPNARLIAANNQIQGIDEAPSYP